MFKDGKDKDNIPIPDIFKEKNPTHYYISILITTKVLQDFSTQQILLPQQRPFTHQPPKNSAFSQNHNAFLG